MPMHNTVPDKNISDDDALNAAPKVTKTTGEKWFDVVRFTTGEVVILGATAALAYASKYGPDSHLNILKTWDKWLTKKLMPADPANNDFRVRLAGAVASSTVLMHGGNLFVPVMKAMQDKRAHIVAYFNEKFGLQGEVEAGNDRLKHQTKETWGDIIKGRLASWVVVFSSFFGADMIAGKKTMLDGRVETRFDLLKDKVGRLVAGVTKEGREIAKTPLAEKLTEEQFHNKTYRFGKILALDVFATTAALAIWSTVSKFSAIMRGRKGEVAREAGRDLELLREGGQPHSTAAETTPDTGTVAQEPQTSHAARIGERPVDYRSLAEKVPATSAMELS